MPKAAIFLPAAQRDVAEIHDYYESHGEGLGGDFLLRVEAAVAHAAEWPESCPIVMDVFRRILTRRFPYALFYEIAGASIWVHAVFHCARNPRTVRERLQ
jgi:plasmid stabilization system protein ParE